MKRMRRFLAGFSLVAVLASLAVIASVTPAAAYGSCVGNTGTFKTGWKASNSNQPNQRKFEGVSATTVFSNGNDCYPGTTDHFEPTYIGIEDSFGTDVYFARIGYELVPSNSCYQLFYWISSPHDNRYSFAAGCLVQGSVHSLQVKMVGSGCSRPPDCIQLFADGVLKAQTVDNPVVDWVGPLQQEIYSRSSNSEADIPGYATYEMEYQAIQLQNWNGTWSSICGNYSTWTGQNDNPSRYASAWLTGSCGTGTNQLNLWTSAP